MSQNDETIEVPVWTSGGGGMRVLRDSLDPEHPESTYNYIKNVLNKIPEDYGYYISCLLPEQIKLLSTISDEVLVAELRKREQAFTAKEMYGD